MSGMKITDAIVSALIKKGVMFEGRNLDIEMPVDEEGTTVKIQIEHCSIKFEKD
jgi:hypothetical protein